MKPMRSRRSCGQLAVVEPGQLDAGDAHRRPTVGRSSPARMCMSVDLPEPDGPMIAAKRAGREVDGDAGQGIDGGLALAVAAAQILRLDERLRAVCGGCRIHVRSRAIRSAACVNVQRPPAGSRGRSQRVRIAPSIVRPMHETTPQVFLIARPSIDVEGMRGYLADVGGESWLERRLDESDGDAERRRAARRVRRARLLPQLGAGPEPERHQGPHRPARVLRQHPALGARQRARARELLVRAAERLEPCLHP